MIFMELFLRFALIAVCSFGGAYASLPMIQEQIVHTAGWMTIAQYADLVSVSEMTPGPFLLNAATFCGSQTAGVAGAVAATAGSVFPSFLICTLIAGIYYSGKQAEPLRSILAMVRPAVSALILAAGFGLLRMAWITTDWITDLTGLPVDLWAVFMVAACFFLLRRGRSPIAIIGISALSGLLVYWLLPVLTNMR